MIVGPISRMFSCDRLGLLGEVHGEAGEQRAGEAHHLLADPGEREEGDELVLFELAVHLHQVRRHAEQVAERQHRPLGEPGRAGGVADEREVLVLRRGDVLREEPRVALLQLPPEVLDLLEIEQERLPVPPHPARVAVDDVADLGELLLHVEDLVDLLLVLGDDERGVGVVDDVRHLLERGVLVQPQRDRARRLRRHLGPHPLGPVVADDGHLVPGLEAEGDHAEGEVLDVVVVFLPAELLPDAELLFAHRDLAVAERLRVADEELGKRVVGLEDLLHPVSAPPFPAGSRRPRRCTP